MVTIQGQSRNPLIPMLAILVVGALLAYWLHDKLDTANADIAGLRSSVSNLRSELCEAQVEIGALRAEVSNLESELDNQDEESSWDTAPVTVQTRLRQCSKTPFGKVVHTVGIPIHWGFEGLTKPGYLANTLTPFVGDANVQTPEFKAFIVNVEKV